MSADQLSAPERRKLTWLAHRLLIWYGKSGRDFPWRSPDAGVFEKIVVEVLLQRTTATAVARFYDAFFSRFSSWEELAGASPKDLESFLKPLGLWRRRSTALLGLAKYAVETKGLFPINPNSHVDIPAVGQYVSNAIMMFQHDRPAALLDVNMARVIERFVRTRRLADIRYDPWLQAAAAWIVKTGDPAAVNWAVLDFAAVVCKARRPLCPTCPVRSHCRYFVTPKFAL